jgi:peptidoglycan/xylan/chitin deacetylase (PgdA/CDA1 family)
MYRPFLDERSSPEFDWPEEKQFAVCLTHDVDYVSQESFIGSLRRFQNLRNTRDLLSKKEIARRSLSSCSSLLTSMYNRLLSNDDPLHCYEEWLNLEDEYGAKSTFFFLPNKVSERHPSDHHYRYSDTIKFDNKKMSVESIIKEIDKRGWEIGLHPTWASATNTNEMREQKESLSQVLDTELVSIRQHYLNYDINNTPRIQEEAGFKYDSSLGFNDNIGFRFGTSYPWQLWDLKNSTYTDMIEIPLVVQDTALLSSLGLRLDQNRALNYVKTISDRVRDVNGVLTLSWHPGYINNESYFDLYEQILEYLSDQNAWLTTTREVGEWIQTKNETLLKRYSGSV